MILGCGHCRWELDFPAITLDEGNGLAEHLGFAGVGVVGFATVPIDGAILDDVVDDHGHFVGDGRDRFGLRHAPAEAGIFVFEPASSGPDRRQGELGELAL